MSEKHAGAWQGRLQSLFDRGLPGSSRAWLFALFLFALAARAACVFAISNFDDVTGYENEEIALNLVAGRGYSFSHFGPVEPTAFMYPLYSFFLAAHFKLFGHDWRWVELSQALIGALGAPLMALLGFRLFNRLTGWLAGAMFALYPIYVYWCTQGQALTIEVTLFLALVLAWDRGLKSPGVKTALVPGALLGLCGLSKTLYLAFLPAFVIWSRYRGGLRWGPALRYSFLVLITALLVILPWTVRNAAQFHRFILVTDNTGFNLWLGNNPAASGGLYTADGRHLSATVSGELKDKVRAAPDSPSRDDVFRRAAVDYIRANPCRFLALIPGRLRALWWFDPYMPSSFGRFRNLVYIGLLIPALAGLALSWPRLNDLCLFPLMYITITGLYSIFFGQSRFRFVIEWSLLLFGAFALAALLTALFGRLRTGGDFSRPGANDKI